ncbi:hypothetical protein OCUBac02_24860 [Bosea sp. ANAM02]|nr:hypothetical protein OCUBac02_24860 [Bosea sp. ANAM02]
MILVRPAQPVRGAKPRVQLTGKLMDSLLRFDIRKEREEIAGWAVDFSRLKLPLTVEVENELHIQ